MGDAAGGQQFTHLAGYHAGLVLREAMFGLPAGAATIISRGSTYTDPELAQIGLTEAEAPTALRRAAERGPRRLPRNPTGPSPRAAPAGFVKLMVARGRPVGVAIVGVQAPAR